VLLHPGEQFVGNVVRLRRSRDGEFERNALAVVE